MEVHFTSETEKKLSDLAAQNGRASADELVQSVVEGYFDELALAREMLSSRYDDLKTGRVKPISGDEVEAHFREKSAAARRLPTALKYAFYLSSLAAAYLWFWSAAVPIPTPSFWEGLTPNGKFMNALGHSAHLNSWAAAATGLSVVFSAPREWSSDTRVVHRPGRAIAKRSRVSQMSRKDRDQWNADMPASSSRPVL